jgi:hypothetical protein
MTATAPTNAPRQLGSLASSRDRWISTFHLRLQITEDRRLDRARERGRIDLSSSAAGVVQRLCNLDYVHSRRERCRHRQAVPFLKKCCEGISDDSGCAVLRHERRQSEFLEIQHSCQLRTSYLIANGCPDRLLQSTPGRRQGERCNDFIDHTCHFALDERDGHCILVGKILVKRSNTDSGPSGDLVGCVALQTLTLEYVSRTLEYGLDRNGSARLSGLLSRAQPPNFGLFGYGCFHMSKYSYGFPASSTLCGRGAACRNAAGASGQAQVSVGRIPAKTGTNRTFDPARHATIVLHSPVERR